MTETLNFDVLIIGGGQAGPPLARALAKAGKTVALAERKYLGGSCVNFGCTPTKAAIASARVAHLARRAGDFGLRISQVDVDFAAVIRRASEIALESRTGLDRSFENSANPKLLRGHARFLGPGFVLQVDETRVTAKQVVIDTGTRTAIPDIPGLDKINYIHSGNWLRHTQLPERLAMVGGDYIGLEMAQFYRRMGSQVVVWERGPRIAMKEDEDVSAAIQKFLELEGIQFRLGAHIQSMDDLDGADVFLATGRKPNTDDLGLEKAGIETDQFGFIKVNARLETNVPGTWALGDVKGGPAFTHISYNDFQIVDANLTQGKNLTTDNRIVPYSVFTDPQLGGVGMTEKEARAKGYQLKIGKIPMSWVARAIERDETAGLMKIIVDAATDRILGATVLATDGGELIHVLYTLMLGNLPYTLLKGAVYIHPTLAEGFFSLMEDVKLVN